MSPLVFNIFLEAIIAIAFKGLEAVVMTEGEILADLRFADDIALLSEEEAAGMQVLVNNVVDTSRKMRMRLNTSKTELQCLGKSSQRFQIQVDGQQLQQTDNFVYLGGSISSGAELKAISAEDYWTCQRRCSKVGQGMVLQRYKQEYQSERL